MGPIRILIADDHTLLRSALAELLGTEPDFEVVGMAGDVEATLRLAAELDPQVVLLDIEMPGNHNPPATVRALQQAVPGVRILVLTMHDDPRLVQALLPLDIRGFLHKTVTHQALSAAVRDACTLGSRVTLSLLAHSLTAPAGQGPGALSPRELQVVEPAAHGFSNSRIARNYRIARSLEIIEGTVKRHMRNIFEKLGTGSRVEAANKAVEMGLTAPPGHRPQTPSPQPTSPPAHIPLGPAR
ncbi:response regulator [Streptomyces sp. NPDC058989]|uniref:response regulator n=1 Tax=Streptomyces sp. NPDC058989 TaxID=3346686 RepID=UPI0036BA7F1B